MVAVAARRWAAAHARTGRVLCELKRLDGENRTRVVVLTAAVSSEGEIEVVRRVAQGLRNKEIARRLEINEGTVKIDLHNVYGKLGIDGRLALSAYLRERGVAAG